MRRHTGTSLIVALALTGCGTATTLHAAATATTPPAASSRTERPPTCYPVIFTENSGNGPTYHVRICDALLRPRPGHEWQLIVDGGPLGNRAVIFGE
jgi:hypothetical protein